MKCRLYPTNTQKKAIDDALDGIRVFHNCLVYDMFHNKVNLLEKERKADIVNLAEDSNSEKVHFADWKASFSKEYKDKLIAEHPIIRACPQAALTTNVGLKADLKRELGNKPIEYQKPTYYNEIHPRQSFSYQETLSKIKAGNNDNVFRFNLSLIGPVKVRGWNKKLRFENEGTDFLAWAAMHGKEKITVVVSRDTAGDYFIVFKIKKCLKPFAKLTENKIGIDVGVSDIAVCSDKSKFENKRFKKQEKRHQKVLSRKLSRQWGPSNEKYRKARKENRSERKKFLDTPELCESSEIPAAIHPSKRYLRTKQQHARLNRKIKRKRDQWNHEISRKIVENNGTIAIEALNIKGMMRNKYLSYALADAAFGELLQCVKYKAAWHSRALKVIDKWTPSSKRCSSCGYIYTHNDKYKLRPWNLSIRSWICPVCGAIHDRDINAAKNILYYAEINK